MTMALCFNNITLSPVTHQNSLWIRAAELAHALGFAREDKVTQIYQRHADEFTPDMTQLIENAVEPQNGVQGNLAPGRCRIFSLRGCHLLAMFARTPVAKAFRRWVLDVLDRLAAEERAALPEVPHIKITPSTTASRKPAEGQPGKTPKSGGLRTLFPESGAVSIVDGISRVSSVAMAKAWGRRHSDMLRTIRDLSPYCQPEFFAQAFVPGEHTTRKGLVVPMFHISHKGLICLLTHARGRKISMWRQYNAKMLKAALPVQQVPAVEDMNVIPAEVAEAGRKHLPPVSKTDLCTLPTQAKQLPMLQLLFKDIRAAAEALALSENWTHISVRKELRDRADPKTREAVNRHVDAAWYALGMARSSLLAAVVLGKLGQ